MAELTTIARPYARAAFEAASAEDGGLARWSEMLQLAAAIASDPAMQDVLAGPALDSQHKAGLFLELCGDQLSPEGSNFIRLLAENNRLAVLPDIAAVFEELRAEAEQTVEAELVSAFEVSDAQRDQIAAALSKRLGREVVLNCTVDDSLLGGAIIRTGDLVIDGSAQGKLAKLAVALRQ